MSWAVLAFGSDTVPDPDLEPVASSNMVETMLMDEVLALALSSFSSPSKTVTGTFEMMALGRSSVLRRLLAFNSSRVKDLGPAPLLMLLLLLLFALLLLWTHCEMFILARSASVTDFGRSTARPEEDDELENPLPAPRLCPVPLVPLWNPPMVGGDIISGIQGLSRPSATL